MPVPPEFNGHFFPGGLLAGGTFGLGDFCPGGLFRGGFCPGGLLPGGLFPRGDFLAAVNACHYGWPAASMSSVNAHGQPAVAGAAGNSMFTVDVNSC